MDFEVVKSLITTGIDDAEVRVTDLTGTKDHLGILIISDAFIGVRLLKQHQMIMDILKESLKEEIHAVQLKTLTYEKARSAGLIS